MNICSKCFVVKPRETEAEEGFDSFLENVLLREHLEGEEMNADVAPPTVIERRNQLPPVSESPLGDRAFKPKDRTTRVGGN